MKILACYSDSHIVFLERHFLPSIPTYTSVELVHMEQVCPSGVYTDPLWGSMAARMLAIKASALVSHLETLFISDVDVRFYGDLASDLARMFLDTDADMLMQDDGVGGLCSGSFAAIPGAKVADVLSDAIKLLPKHNGHDQPALNEALANHPEVKVAKLPPRYWSHGAATGKQWEPGMKVDPPADIVVHQANWCIGIERKLALLDQVKRIVEERRCQ